ncbi:disulfide bond formation protein B [Amaricoccus sp.]|uniref:disulfide bond formation protein B n=1 Tax=Amaricoccus sp. TaxID=1872485 RepID=UPI0025C18F58|nr:disulfide bond formation protein B [Amaricoccus sp.]
MNALQRAAIGAATGSALLLAAALAFQHLGGYAPCHLCLLQRWPHAIAVVLGLATLVWPRRELALLGALVMAAGAGIAAWHAGVEQGWWTGPTTCVAPDIAGLTPEQLLQRILDAPVTRCDEIAWSFLGLSMAAWNGLASAVLALIWARGYASSSASQ